jgi:hypothetical protein
LAIEPIYVYEPLGRQGDLVFGLTESDYLKIVNGYGCPKCLEDYNGIWRAKCDVCGHKADLADFQGLAPDFMQPADPSLAYRPKGEIDLRGVEPAA